MTPAPRTLRTILVRLAASLGLLLLVSMALPAAPHSSYATTWAGLYPSSPSLDNVVNGTAASCQLCHQSSGGGNGWNAYGWAMRQQILGGQTSSNAMLLIQGTNSDGDSGGFSNLDEIVSGAQPGWRSGSSNTIFFSNGTTLSNQSAPAGIQGYLDSVSYPTLVRNGSGVNPLVFSDTGGNPNTSPRLNPVEPFRATLDCSGASANGVYSITLRPVFLATPIQTAYGELHHTGYPYARYGGLHGQGVVNTPLVTLPYDLTLVGVPYYAQGFCGSPAGGSFLSNALEQRVGL